jgi:hypothetical protein
MPSRATYRAANNEYKKHLHEAYEKVIQGARLDNSFEPLEMLDLARPMETRLPKDYDNNNPISFLEIFLGEEQY